MRDLLVEAVGLTKHYPARDRRSPGYTAVDAVNQDVADSEIVFILRTSRSGNTSLHPAMACLETGPTGLFSWDRTEQSRVPTHTRGCWM